MPTELLNGRPALNIPPPTSADDVIKAAVVQVSKLEDTLATLAGVDVDEARVLSLEMAKRHLVRARGLLMVTLTGGVTPTRRDK